jgi:uncharacterized protein YneF (UPF0154 family)
MILLQILVGISFLLLLAMGLALVFNKMDAISEYLTEHPRIFPIAVGTLMILMFIGAAWAGIEKGF